MHPSRLAKCLFIVTTLSSFEKTRGLPCALISILSSYTRDSKNRRLSTAVHRRHMCRHILLVLFSCFLPKVIQFALDVIFIFISLCTAALSMTTSNTIPWRRWVTIFPLCPQHSDDMKAHEELTVLSTSDHRVDGADSKEPLRHCDYHGLWKDLWNENHQLT